MRALYVCLLQLVVASLLSAAEIEVETGRGSPIHVLVPGEENRLGLRIVNDGKKEEQFTLKYVVENYDGSRLHDGGETRFPLKPGAKRVFPLPKPEQFGVRFIKATLAGNVSGTISKRLSYCYMKPSGPTAGRAKGFLFGVCVHTQKFPLAEQEREVMAAAWCGVKVFREDIGWWRVERKQGKWDWSYYDQLITLYEKQGIELQAICAWVPGWVLGKFNRTGCPEEWGEFIRRFAKHYRGRVRYMEVWNEPDINTFGRNPKRYLKLLRIAYNETKKNAPEMLVMTGGVSGMVTTDQQTAFVRKMLRDGKKYYDIIAFHGHGSLSSYLTHLNPLLAARKEFGVTAPWYANETAEPSNWSSETGQAVTLFKKLLVSWARGAIGYNWYDLRNDGRNPTNAEHNYGMLTQEFYPKPVYATYNMLAGTFREAEFLENAEPERPLQAYWFRSRENGYLLPAWSDESGETLLAIAGDGKFSRIDLFGNQEQLPALDGIAAYAVGTLPATLCNSETGSKPEIRGKFLSADGAFNLFPGERRDMELNLSNPTKSELLFQVKLHLPKGLSGTRTTAEQRVSPAGQYRLALPLQAERDFRSLPDRPQKIGVELRLTAGGKELWRGLLNREVRTVTDLPRNEFSDRPNFILNRFGQVTRLVPSATENEPRYWKGPDDLSAAIKMATRKNALLLRVEATDNIHCQPYKAEESWKGDNVQCALSIPGQSSLWEIGFTRLADGKPEVWVWMAPSGFSCEKTAAKIKLTTERDEIRKVTVYQAEIPFESIGLSERIGRRGFLFNLLINDNDGKGRDNTISIAPGIAEGKSPERFPTVRFR